MELVPKPGEATVKEAHVVFLVNSNDKIYNHSENTYCYSSLLSEVVRIVCNACIIYNISQYLSQFLC